MAQVRIARCNPLISLLFNVKSFAHRVQNIYKNWGKSCERSLLCDSQWVEQRRNYIEKHVLEVKQLDV